MDIMAKTSRRGKIGLRCNIPESFTWIFSARSTVCPSPGAELSGVIQRRNAGGFQPADGWLRGLHKGEPTSPFAAWFSPDGEARLQALVDGKVPRKGSANAPLLGLHGMVWVSGNEGPDWRVSGANTLTRDQPAIRLAGASRLDAGDAPPRSCLKTGQRPALKPRAVPEDRTDGGTSFSRLCGGQTKFYFVCTTRTHLAVILIAGLTKTGTMLLLRRKGAEDSSGSRMAASLTLRFIYRTLVFGAMRLPLSPLLRLREFATQHACLYVAVPRAR